MEELWGSWVPTAWSFILREGVFFFIFLPPPFFTESAEFKMEKSKIKSKAASLQVRGEKMTVFIVILFHMATDNIFRFCFSFQMFFSGAAELLALLNALLSDIRSTARSSFLKRAIYSVFVRSLMHLQNQFPVLSFHCLFVRSIWILGLSRYYINKIHCTAISTSIAVVGSPMLYSCRKEMVLTNRIRRIFPVQCLERAAMWNPC